MKREEKWVVLAKAADFNGIGKTFGVDPVIARIVRNREVVGEEALRAYFSPELSDLHDPSSLKGGAGGCGTSAEKDFGTEKNTYYRGL